MEELRLKKRQEELVECKFEPNLVSNKSKRCQKL